MAQHWTRPWVRSLAMALTLVAFALPMMSVGGCGCVGPACGQQPNAEAVEEAKTPSNEKRFDAEVTATASGWDAVIGRVSTRAISRDQRLGTSAELQESARQFFDGRARPMYAALLVPLLGLAGAALFFAPGRGASMARVGIGIAGAAAMALVVDAAGGRLLTSMIEFGRTRSITWAGEVNAHLEPAGAVVIALFLVPLAHEILVLIAGWARAAWRSTRGTSPPA